jgi:hypothetical protein
MPRLLSHPQNGQSYLPHHVSDGIGRLRTGSAVNLSIASDRSMRKSKMPLRTASFQAEHREHSNGSVDFSEKASSSQSPKPVMYRASEKGREDVLPKTSGYVSDSVWNRPSKSMSSVESPKIADQRLRRRATSTNEHYSYVDNSNKWSSSDYTVKNHRSRIPLTSLIKLHRLKRVECFQLLIMFGVFFLVVDSYLKALSTKTRLELFQNDESMMMMHLQRIEQQSIHLHENLSKLNDLSARQVASDGSHHAEANPSPIEGVDSNLIRVQTQQLHEMEEELDHELRALQAKLQHVARSAIISSFGEGPVKVVLELEFPDGTRAEGDNAISILLWYDTPHAAWTWLQQIQRGEWNGSHFKIGKSASVDAAPAIHNAGTLSFIEKSQKGHAAWTVGLADNEGHLGMFINLQDIDEVRKHEVCVGKLIDGFDTLQRLVDVVRSDSDRPVNIYRATATHMSRQQRSS